jgi:hypothetical protein
MGNYYFLAPSLPELILGQKPEVSFEELKNRIEINLTKEDYKKARVFGRFIDISNIRALLREEPIDSKGNLSEKELDEALLIHSILPDYVFDFLEHYDTVAEKIRHFSGLVAHFFAEEIPKQKGFLRRYLIFERNWRLILLALRAKELHRDIIHELQFEDLSDPLIAQILSQRDADRYEPPEEFVELKEILHSCGKDPWALRRAFDEWRMCRIEEMVTKPLFSIDWILSYMARLLIVEYAHELDENKGKIIVNTLTQE